MKDVVFVTGGGGFIGHHLVKKLLNSNAVVVLDNFTRGAKERLVNLSGELTIENGDIMDFETVNKIMSKYNIISVFHLAAINGTENFYDFPIEVMDVGVIGCFNILKASKLNNVKNIILASSAEVYQESNIIPTPENVQLIIPEVKNARYSYGLSKIYTEYYAYHFGLKNNLNVSIFRPHNVYGPDMGLKHVIPQFIMQFLTNIHEPGSVIIEPKGSLEAIRSFCFVDDIIEGLEIIHKKSTGVNVFNIGSGEQVNMYEILNLISKIHNKKYIIKETDNIHSGGTSIRCPDISKIESYGFSNKISLENGLEQTFTWYKKNLQRLKEIQNKYY